MSYVFAALGLAMRPWDSHDRGVSLTEIQSILKFTCALCHPAEREARHGRKPHVVYVANAVNLSDVTCQWASSRGVRVCDWEKQGLSGKDPNRAPNHSPLRSCLLEADLSAVAAARHVALSCCRAAARALDLHEAAARELEKESRLAAELAITATGISVFVWHSHNASS